MGGNIVGKRFQQRKEDERGHKYWKISKIYYKNV